MKHRDNVTSNALNIYALHNKQLNDIKEQNSAEDAAAAEIEYMRSVGNILYDYYDVVVNPNSVTLETLVHDRSNMNTILKKYSTRLGVNVNVKGSESEVIVCESCGSEDIFINNDDMLLHCMICHMVSMVTIDIHMMHSLRAGTICMTSADTNYLQAKRRAHFRDWLMSIQGHKTRDVSPEVYNIIYEELYKLRYVTYDRIVLYPEKITDQCIYEILKIHKLGKYYNTIAFICARITGQPSVFLKPQTETLLETLFDVIADPYEKYKYTVEGESLTSYAFIIRKLLERIGETSNLHKFKLVKSKSKLNQYNTLWQKICQEINWVFVPSY